MPVTFALRLSDDGSPNGREKFVRLPPPTKTTPYTICFTLTAGCSSLHHAVLRTNYPNEGEEFERDTFNSKPFIYDTVSDGYCEFPITRPGVYDYYVEYQDIKKNLCRSALTGTFLVDPRLYIRSATDPNKTVITPLDGIVIQTVVPKWLPVITKWLPYFKVSAETGYNMVHFVPLQKRGSSNSPYSIYDQLSIDDDVFDIKCSEHVKRKMLKQVLEIMRTDLGILSVTDVVWNHTAHNSEWLQEHPEAGYNLVNSPHLRPAYELDKSLIDFSEDITNVYGKSDIMKDEHDLNEIVQCYQTKVFPKLRLWEYFVMDTKSLLDQFRETIAKSTVDQIKSMYEDVNIAAMPLKDRANLLKNDALYSIGNGVRFPKKIKTAIAIDFIYQLCKAQNIDYSNINFMCREYEKILNEINMEFYRTYDEDVAVIFQNIANRARYLRLAGHGPRLGRICREMPLVDVCFTVLPLNEVTKKHHPDSLVLANNGWIWNADPLLDFAGPNSSAYLRREVIAWGDCVKLRYGQKRDDNPWLWDHMAEYTRTMAKLFHGFRIDNCHSTPIHLAQYLLDVGRRERPDLYVIAELFTGSEEKDILYVSKLGINSLIREAMNAWDSFELSRLAHRHGGQPAGSFSIDSNYFPHDLLGETDAIKNKIVIDLKGASPHALFMDCTHDNETPYQKRTAEDTLSNAAVVCMTNCACGSVRGYDEIVPELLNVVTEKRKYRIPDMEDGIIPAKSILQKLHTQLAQEGYSEIHVHHETNFISIHRKHPINHDGYLAIIRTAFRGDGDGDHEPINLRQTAVMLMESARLTVYASYPNQANLQPFPNQRTSSVHQNSNQLYSKIRNIDQSKNSELITGLPSILEFSTKETKLCTVLEAKDHDSNKVTFIVVKPEEFKNGSVVLFRTWVLGNGINPRQSMGESPYRRTFGEREQRLLELRKLMAIEERSDAASMLVRLGLDFMSSGAKSWIEKDTKWPPGLLEAVNDLDAIDLNVVLYRSGPEEFDTIGYEIYEVPGYGALSYCGLQGFVSVLQPIARNNDLGHPLCGNLREGPWALDYTIGRLAKYMEYYPNLKKIHDWLSERLNLVKTLPADLIPKYFAIVMFSAYHACRHRALSLMTNLINKDLVTNRADNQSENCTSSLELFTHSLAMVSIQLYGRVKSTGLFPKEYTLNVPESCLNVKGNLPVPSLAAGLPHFSTCHMRCWGRDIFLSLRGIFILTGNYDAAKIHLLAFGSCLKHGLIPNLLDSGRRPRYNARDAVWYYCSAVHHYCLESPEGLEFLKTDVLRRFVPPKKYRRTESGKCPYTEGEAEDRDTDAFIEYTDPNCYKYRSSIAELLHEILERHACGIKFREWNAGTNLDHAMKSEGFNQSIETDLFGEDGKEPTGFVYGGNRWNCGTWMDKMGDSDRAGTKGTPSTPRDGCAIELIGIIKATLRWLIEVHENRPDLYPFSEFNVNGKKVTYKQWDDMIQKSFEKNFYIPVEKPDDEPLEQTKNIHRRGIYKDTFKSTLQYTDYQFRPNFAIAMVEAPELFEPEHAKQCLKLAKNILAGPLGIKTLDPNDWNYRGYYDNGNDSDDPTVAHGFNYHNGPEWVWVMGYFLRAYLKFMKDDPETINEVQKTITCHKEHILDTAISPFAGLPELTNANGSVCPGSCPTQAWSMATILEAVNDLVYLVNERGISPV